MSQTDAATKSKEQINPNANKQNNKTNKSEEEEKKEELQKSSSSYYLYKSTNPEEAKKYAPKKLDNGTAQSIEKTVKQSSKGSSWNTGATMEQFDYSEWMKKRIEALLLGVTFRNSQIRIIEVTKVEGDATILLTRGKYRPGYDISFECKWKGYSDPNYVENEEHKQQQNDSKEDPEDWEYEVSIKKKSKINKAGASLVKKDRESVIEAINVFIKEFKSKK